LNVTRLPGKILGHALEVRDEGFLAVGHVRVVLRVRIADIALDGFARPALVEHEVVERRDGALVALDVRHARTATSRSA
jgi:hypothetical protein